jgi:hypothetical protein
VCTPHHLRVTTILGDFTIVEEEEEVAVVVSIDLYDRLYAFLFLSS